MTDLPYAVEYEFTPGYIDGDPCDTNHPGPHSPEVCVHTTYDHDVCCYLPLGCLGGCTQPGGCMDPSQPSCSYCGQTASPGDKTCGFCQIKLDPRP